MTLEQKTREYLIKERNYSSKDASLEAFMLVEAVIDGTISPEEARDCYGVTKEEYYRTYNWNYKEYIKNNRR